jgi:competence protein ComEC
MLLITEIQKRPLARPLLFWIAGIILYTLFPLQKLSLCLPALAATVLFASICIASNNNNRLYIWNARWLWGALFASLIIFLAIQTSAIAELNALNPTSKPQPRFLSLANSIREALIDKLAALNLPQEHINVLASITLGFKKSMTAALKQQFSVAGVAHILVVSGFHVAVVFAFVRTALAFLSDNVLPAKIIKYAIALIIIWSYSCVAGLGPASVRAALMLSFFIAAKMLNRQGDKYNSLAAAALCQLFLNPFDLFNPGFQLSYAAVLAILYLKPRFDNALNFKNPLVKLPTDAISVSCAAQIGVSFLLFFYFGYFSLVFIFTNLFLSFISLILIPLTLMWLIMPLCLQPLASLLQPAIETLTRFLMNVVDSFNNVSWAKFELKFDLTTTLASYCALVMLLFWFRQQRYYQLFLSLTLLFIILLRFALFH